jgi:hypothetical protein
MANSSAIRITTAPNVRRIGPGWLFERLSTKEKLYAHHSSQYGWTSTLIWLQLMLSRAAWSGTEIILRRQYQEQMRTDICTEGSIPSSFPFFIYLFLVRERNQLLPSLTRVSIIRSGFTDSWPALQDQGVGQMLQYNHSGPRISLVSKP